MNSDKKRVVIGDGKYTLIFDSGRNDRLVGVDRHGSDWIDKPENIPLLPNWVHAALYYMLCLHEAAGGAEKLPVSRDPLWLEADAVRQEFTKLRQLCDFAVGYLNGSGSEAGQALYDRVEGFQRFIEGGAE